MAKKPAWKLDWNEKLIIHLGKAISDALVEYGLRVERGAKKELKGGHGVLTGTLRRSIHVERPSYNWGGDDVTPGSGTPERGGQEVKTELVGGVIKLEIGSGMVYAMAVHQGHGSFPGYHYLIIPHSKEWPKFPKILNYHCRQVK